MVWLPLWPKSWLSPESLWLSFVQIVDVSIKQSEAESAIPNFTASSASSKKMQHMGSVFLYCFTNIVCWVYHMTSHDCSPEIPENISPGADSCSRRGAATHVALQVLRGSGSRSAKIPSCCNETGGWLEGLCWIPAGSTWDRNCSKHVPSHLVLQCVLDIGSYCNCTDGTLKSLKIASYFWYDQARKQPLDKSSKFATKQRNRKHHTNRDKSRQTC